ncbi:MAG: baseplate assembly protein [Deferribacterales bacterium]
MKNTDLKALLKRAVEIVMPNLRKYYRVVRKAKVVATYASDGRYFCDVQPLRNDESEDSNEPVLTCVEIPVIWAGQSRGIVCPPAVGSMCDLEYYDGDPSFPRISNFRWLNNGAPAAEVGDFIIQQSDGVYVRICANTDVEVRTPGDVMATADTIILTASEKIVLDTPLVQNSGNMENAKLLTTGGIASEGTYGTGGIATFKKGVKVDDGDVIADNISLKEHRHPITDGNNYTGVATQ